MKKASTMFVLDTVLVYQHVSRLCKMPFWGAQAGFRGRGLGASTKHAPIQFEHSQNLLCSQAPLYSEKGCTTTAA